MKYKKSLRYRLFKNWVPLLVLTALIFSLVWPAFRQISAQDTNLIRYLATNNVEVGSETVNGYQQVYYVFNGTKNFITEGNQNSTQAVSDGEYIAFSTAVKGAGQIFLYHIPSDTTKQITSTRTNLQPRLSNGKVVFEGWVQNKWQVFLYDGVSVSQITTGDQSMSPDIEGDQVVYASKDEKDEWRTLAYSLGSKKASVIKNGTLARYPKFKDGQIVFGLPAEQVVESLSIIETQRLYREATRLAGEDMRIATDAKLLADSSIAGEPPVEPDIIDPLFPVLESCVETLPEKNIELPLIPTDIPAIEDLSATTILDVLKDVIPDPIEVKPIVNCAKLHVIKLVVNEGEGTAVASDFTVELKKAGLDAAGSPAPGEAAPGIFYSLSPGTYIIDEEPDDSYIKSFSGDCDSSGSITLSAGDEKICTIFNTDIPPPAPVEPPVEGDETGDGLPPPVVAPLIGILKIPAPLLVLAESGPVTYDYTVWNIGGQLSLIDVTVTDDGCSPLILISGDDNGDNKLDPSESWKYNCVATLSATTTNTAVATGYSDDINREAAIDTAIVTVVVGSGLPVEPPVFEPPAIVPPATEPPVIEPPVIVPPAAEPPVVEPPVTEPPTTIETPNLEPPSTETPSVGFPDTGFSDMSFLPPLINIIQVPSRLTPFPFRGGDVTYTYTITNPGVVSVKDVAVTDDKCGSVSGPILDANGNNLLDPGEIWTYTCRTNISISTRNVATVKGSANGFTALDYAFASVLVTAPGFPETGLFALGKNKTADIVVLIGIVILALVLFVIFHRKNIVRNIDESV